MVKCPVLEVWSEFLSFMSAAEIDFPSLMYAHFTRRPDHRHVHADRPIYVVVPGA
jgi:hypothetical protein